VSTILDQIVADTRGVIALRRRERSLAELERMEGFDRTPHRLDEALLGAGVSIIAEAKKASPSKGVIRDPFDVRSIVRSYTENGAAAISILTEPVHFQGHPDFLRAAREETDLPLLRKDFIVDPYQVVEARAIGADAILLIATILDRDQAAELMETADSLGLSVLMELYDVRELDRLDVDRLNVIGVNSRDLHTFEVNLERAAEALSLLPAHVVRVAESGIAEPADLDVLRANRVHAALIGESFMRAADPGAALARFTSA